MAGRGNTHNAIAINNELAEGARTAKNAPQLSKASLKSCEGTMRAAIAPGVDILEQPARRKDGAGGIGVQWFEEHARIGKPRDTAAGVVSYGCGEARICVAVRHFINPRP